MHTQHRGDITRKSPFFFVVVQSGHKSLNKTILYTQLISFNNDDYTASVAHSEDEACKLVEAGFEYVCGFNENKIFRKL